MALDFGSDFSCVDDFEEEMRVISDPALLIGQALVRRWQTPRGMLIDDEDYGTDLTEYLNEDVDQLALARMRAETRSEALKDERVSACNVISSRFDRETNTIILELEVVVSSLAIRLKVAVSELTVELLSVE